MNPWRQPMCAFRMSHFTHMNKSCQTYGWVMSHMWMSYFTDMNWVMYDIKKMVWHQKTTHSWTNQRAINPWIPAWCLHYYCASWLIHICDMTHSYVWHDTFIRVARFVHMCALTHSYVWHDPFICVTCLIHMWDVTQSHHTSLRYAWVMSHTSMSHVTLMDESLRPRK